MRYVLKTIEADKLQEISMNTIISIAQQLPYEGYAIWDEKSIQVAKTKAKKLVEDIISQYEEWTKELGGETSDEALADYEYLRSICN